MWMKVRPIYKMHLNNLTLNNFSDNDVSKLV